MVSAAESELARTLARYEIQLPAEQIALLEQYCQQLWQWNERLNLTRHTDYEAFVTRDVIDSLQLAQLLTPGERVLDVGSGGGVPGVLLAILRPDVQVALSEGIAKKARAVEQIVAALGLSVPVFNERAEEVVTRERFETLVARAVGPLAKIVRWFTPVWPKFQRMLLVKGPKWVDERGEARHRGLMHALQLRRVASYKVPGRHAESVILMLTRKNPPTSS